jgi:hypothetical protein
MIEPVEEVREVLNILGNVIRERSTSGNINFSIYDPNLLKKIEQQKFILGSKSADEYLVDAAIRTHVLKQLEKRGYEIQWFGCTTGRPRYGDYLSISSKNEKPYLSIYSTGEMIIEPGVGKKLIVQFSREYPEENSDNMRDVEWDGLSLRLSRYFPSERINLEDVQERMKTFTTSEFFKPHSEHNSYSVLIMKKTMNNILAKIKAQHYNENSSEKELLLISPKISLGPNFSSFEELTSMGLELFK